MDYAYAIEVHGKNGIRFFCGFGKKQRLKTAWSLAGAKLFGHRADLINEVKRKLDSKKISYKVFKVNAEKWFSIDLHGGSFTPVNSEWKDRYLFYYGGIEFDIRDIREKLGKERNITPHNYESSATRFFRIALEFKGYLDEYGTTKIYDITSPILSNHIVSKELFPLNF